MTTVTNPREQLRFVRRLEDPPFARALFGDVRWSWLWLLVRLYVGYEWLTAGLGKLGNPAWTGEKAGAALTGRMAAGITPEQRQQIEQHTPTRRITTPEDVAALIVFLGSPVNRQVTGEVVRITGGR